MKFSGQSALVAGAGGGMGLQIAGDLLQKGIHVCMADIKPPPENAPDGPGKSIYIQTDLTRKAGIDKLVSATLAEFGRIDYLVNTLGVLWFGKDKSVVEIDLEVWDEVMNINLRSIVLLTKAVVPEILKHGGGAMVHFSSIDALSGDPVPQDAYGASKAALIRLSKSLAIQFAENNLRSNVILPGPTLTPMQQRWQNKPDLQSKIGATIPLGRLGSTQDMSDACLFLLSDHASWITGTELVVDGGITALP